MVNAKKSAAAIDWKNIQQRLASIEKGLEAGWTVTPARKQEVLRLRAREFAREITGKERFAEEMEVVEFLLASERYAVEAAYVREVYPLKSITALPGTPPFVMGIVNVRGRILSIIDLKKFFELPEKGLGDLNRIIILSSGQMEFGILADMIVGARKLPGGDLQPSLPTLTAVRGTYLKGIAAGGLVVLDAGKLLGDKSIIVDAGDD